jgi:hypothetical protein
MPQIKFVITVLAAGNGEAYIIGWVIEKNTGL